MERKVGTVSRGVRCPIIREKDDLVEIVTTSILEAAESENFTVEHQDIIAMTESIVARAQGNYVSVDTIASDIKSKLGDGTIGVVFPILSRNRYSTILRSIAKAASKVVIQLSYPSDEVGNALITLDQLDESGVNPYSDVLNLEVFRKLFGNTTHPFTGIDYISYYAEIVTREGAEVEFVFSNNPTSILDHADAILTSDIHSNKRTRRILKNAGATQVLGLDDILTESINGSGYNKEFGLLGSNKSTEDEVKLFPRECFDLVEAIQARMLELTGKHVEVMVYGDGAFKDPMGMIWELADPTVSPAYTIGLEGTPNEIKLKYLADNDYKDISGQELQDAIRKEIENKAKDTSDTDASLGTTPRRVVDLVGSLCDLTSGSGDKGTPIVFIQGYFDNFSSK